MADLQIVLCVPCQATGESLPAIKYCVNCSDPLCKACVEYHRKFKVTKSHKLVDCSAHDTRHFKGAKQLSIYMTCPDHDDITVKLLCEEHGALCCLTCASTTHRSCRNVSEINKLAAGCKTSGKIDKIRTRLEGAGTCMQEIIDVNDACRNDFENSREEIPRRLAEIKRKILKLFERMESAVMETVKNLHTNEDIAIGNREENWKLKLNANAELLEALDVITEVGTESQVFVALHKMKGALLESENALSDQGSHIVGQRLNLKLKDKLEKFMQTDVIDNLVAVESIQNQYQLPKTVDYSKPCYDVGDMISSSDSIPDCQSGEQTTETSGLATTAATAMFGASTDSPQTTKKHSIKRDEISTINLKIYSDDKKNIDVCIKEIENAVELEYTNYTLRLSGYRELIKDLNKEEMTKLEESGGVVDMKIDQNDGVIRITGPKKFVLNAQTNLRNCLKGIERIRQQTEEAEMLHQLIQWQFEEVTNKGIELVPYKKLTNLRIENAYKNKQPFVELFDKQNNVTYVVDFLCLEEYEKTNKENSTVVVRKDILKLTKHALPPEWMTMKDDENVHILNIGSSDPIYQQIEKQFVSEVKSGQYNNRIGSIKNVKVTKIDRIQNKALYWQYMTKKELMMKQTPNPLKRFPIERKVWHQTSHVAVSSIAVHGFNRSYAGDKYGDPWYGNGVYFAGDASYSARSWLSGANSAGDGTTKGYIFLVKALTGEFCKGTRGMRYLPPKNPANPTVLYDCAVDDPANPVEFVIFHDAQAYPEFLITFVA